MRPHAVVGLGLSSAAFVKYDENKNGERIRLDWLHRPIRFVTTFKERSTSTTVVTKEQQRDDAGSDSDGQELDERDGKRTN